MGLDIGLAEVPAHPVHWAFALATSLPAMPMDLLIVIPAMLAHWAFYQFSWASTAYLIYFNLLLCLWACLLPFLPYWPIGPFYLFSWASRAHLLYFYLVDTVFYMSSICVLDPKYSKNINFLS